jgi:hypothetical protein
MTQDTQTQDPQTPDAQTPDPKDYIPPDPTQIETNNPQAVQYWASSLGKQPEQIRDALRKVGPLVEDIKQELGIGGVG